MSPLVTGLMIAAPVAIGLGLGLAIKSALSNSEVPFEASQDAIEMVENFQNENGIGFDDYHVRGAVLAVVTTVAPFVEIPEDLDPSDLPASMPHSPEAIIDYVEENLDMDLSEKQCSKIRKEFARLEKEWDEKGKDSEESKSGDPEEETDPLAEDETEEGTDK